MFLHYSQIGHMIKECPDRQNQRDRGTKGNRCNNGKSRDRKKEKGAEEVDPGEVTGKLEKTKKEGGERLATDQKWKKEGMESNSIHILRKILQPETIFFSENTFKIRILIFRICSFFPYNV